VIRAILLTAVLVGATACGSQPTRDAEPADARVDVSSAFRSGPIVCGSEGVDDAPSRIRARKDGVHLHFRNTSKRKLGYRLGFADGSGEGGSIPPGRSSVVVPAPPGALMVTCTTDPSWHGPSASVEVVDPLGHAVGVRLDCGTQSQGIPDYAADARGEHDLIAATRRMFAEDLRAGDMVRELDYVRDGERAVIVQRADRTMARADFFPADRGGWLVSSVNRCGDF